MCDKVDRIYFSRTACTDAKILPEMFPYPMDSQDSFKTVDIMHNFPTRLETLPYPPTEANIIIS